LHSKVRRRKVGGTPGNNTKKREKKRKKGKSITGRSRLQSAGRKEGAATTRVI